MKILIAEDDPISRRMLERTLIGWGHDIVACGDGKAAWDILQVEGATRPDCLKQSFPQS